VAGVWKGFRELKTLGLIARTPRILGVQAEGAAPVTAAFLSGEPVRPMEPSTIADSIAVGVPRNWKRAILAIHESGGMMINVSDPEILEAMRYTGRLAGIFAEPAAATAVAGLRRALEEGRIARRSSVVALITGNGLKDVQSARSAAGLPYDISPDGAALEDILRERKLIA
jgi:threonine synthase